MKIIYVFILLILAAASLPAQDIKAVTDDGRQVILHSNGKWEYTTPDKTASGKLPVYNKPADSKSLIKGKKETYGIWYNDKKWKLLSPDKTNNSSAEYQFEHTNGDANAMVIFERIEMNVESLKNIALENAKNAAPDAKIIYEDRRIVNGSEVLCVRIIGTIDNIAFQYYNYYYAGPAGTIQMVTFTSQNLIQEYENDFLDFLNGFVTFKK